MNKKNNRKGFTIVELVIVIAVIAILATVLVPTFGNVIANANKSAAIQEAKNVYTEYIAKKAETGTYEDTLYVKTGENQWVKITKGQVADNFVTSISSETVHTLVVEKTASGLVYDCCGACTDTNAADTTCPLSGVDKVPVPANLAD